MEAVIHKLWLILAGKGNNRTRHRGGVITMRWSPMDEVNVMAQLGDLKENHYKNTLILTALVELLVERGLIRREEVLEKAYELDDALLKQLLV